jgi:hypothetical protein
MLEADDLPLGVRGEENRVALLRKAAASHLGDRERAARGRAALEVLDG